ncbi:MAG: polysaccharide export protein [Sphingomonadales bacterium]|nr:polysaccharide export protein [Sphingomonadales bacterium]MDE2171658.1 polysaccharide export protein [Sphingomonadales bacterium]
MKLARAVLAFMAAATLGGCAADIAKTPPGAPPAPPYVYKLAPDDHLRINVYGEPNLSAEYIVNTNGDISFPMVGAFHVQGMTVNDVATQLTQALKTHYYKTVNLAVDLLAPRPIYVLGEVTKSGQYPYQSGMTALGAIATAGGFTYRANEKTVMIRHPGAAAEEREPLTADLPVQPGDTIRVRERNF